jgi:hypothetical protein
MVLHNRPDFLVSTSHLSQEAEVITTALRHNYRDAIRLAAREEILAELAQDMVTAQLHVDTARFHHGSAHAYAKALDLLMPEGGPDLFVDKREARLATTEADLAPMRCQGRHYKSFHPEKL